MSRGATSQFCFGFCAHLAHGPLGQGAPRGGAEAPGTYSASSTEIGVRACITLLCWVFFSFRTPNQHVGCIPAHLETPCGHPRIGPWCYLSAVRRVGGFWHRSKTYFFKSPMRVCAPSVYHGVLLVVVSR